jgi:glycosyltransferase involved in cell wall biosynthesis
MKGDLNKRQDDVSNKRSLRIGLIIYGSLESCSGGYLYDRKVVEGLRARGHAVEILSLPLRNYGRHLVDNFSTALLRQIKQANWDVLIQDELSHPSLILVNRRIKRETGYPILSIVHHLRCCESRPRLLNAAYQVIETQYLTTIHGFIYNSATTRAVVRKILKQDRPGVVAYPGRDHMIPGMTHERIMQRCKNPGPLRILFLGNVIPRKGLHVLIRSLAILRGNGWRLTVAGDLSVDPSYARQVQTLVQKLLLGDSIAFTGRVASKDLPGLMAEHHCLAMPSFYEGFGIAGLEAMGFGQPVIATTAGAGSEWIRHGEEGWIIPPESESSLAAVIQRWIHDRELLMSMSLAAFRKYTGHPTWNDAAEGVDRFICGMVSGVNQR